MKNGNVGHYYLLWILYIGWGQGLTHHMIRRISIAWVVDQMSVLVSLLSIFGSITHHSLVTRSLVGPVSLSILISLYSNSVLRSWLVFLSDELSSKSKSIGLSILLVLLLLLHDIWIVRVVSTLTSCHLELVALVYALRCRSLVEWATL